MNNNVQVRLTEYSHGAGCGCKISPQLLDEMLSGSKTDFVDANLLVGNESKDDAAVYDLGNGKRLSVQPISLCPLLMTPSPLAELQAVMLSVIFMQWAVSH